MHVYFILQKSGCLFDDNIAHANVCSLRRKKRARIFVKLNANLYDMHSRRMWWLLGLQMRCVMARVKRNGTHIFELRVHGRCGNTF